MSLLPNRYGSRATPSALAVGGLVVIGFGAFARLLSIRDDEAWLLHHITTAAYVFAGLLFLAALVTVAFTRGARWPHAFAVLALAAVALSGIAWGEAEYARGMTYVP